MSLIYLTLLSLAVPAQAPASSYAPPHRPQALSTIAYSNQDGSKTESATLEPSPSTSASDLTSPQAQPESIRQTPEATPSPAVAQPQVDPSPQVGVEKAQPQPLPPEQPSPVALPVSAPSTPSTAETTEATPASGQTAASPSTQLPDAEAEPLNRQWQSLVAEISQYIQDQQWALARAALSNPRLPIALQRELLAKLELAIANQRAETEADWVAQVAIAQAARQQTDWIPGVLPFAMAPTQPIVPFLPADSHSPLVFPLALPAPITSGFGWRMHPVLGNWRFHNGIDLGADYGTPVVAATAGRVITADWLDGYGWTVIVETADGNQQFFYAHLSEINVQSGAQVVPGQMVGRVGSSGLSTGPHLHFEVRQLSPVGWVAVDVGPYVQAANERLAQALELNPEYATWVAENSNLVSAPSQIAAINPLQLTRRSSFSLKPLRPPVDELTIVDLVDSDLLSVDMLLSSPPAQPSATSVAKSAVFGPSPLGRELIELNHAAVKPVDLLASELISLDLFDPNSLLATPGTEQVAKLVSYLFRDDRSQP